MDIVEVVLRPNFDSADEYEILGCSQAADADELERAYRDLSRKYHPNNRLDDDDTSGIFVKLGEAYANLTTDRAGRAANGERNSRLSPPQMTALQAKAAYEKKFGKYRRLYFVEGGVIGIPYAYQLREQDGAWTKLLSKTTCGTFFRLGFLRSRLLKLKLDTSFGLLETVLTGITLAACK